MMTRALLAELNLAHAEYPSDVPSEAQPTADDLSMKPIYIALVDLTGDALFIEAVSASLLALLEGLPTCAHFGIVTFAERIGLFDMSSSHPLYKTVAAAGDATGALALSDVCPLHRMATEICLCLDAITNAVESLRVLACPGGQRAFGPALEALLQCIASHKSPLNVRVLAFLSGAPNNGTGILRPVELANGAGLNPTTTYYKEKAQQAALLGVGVDIIAVTSSFVGLPSLRFLPELTGGYVRVYDPAWPKSSVLARDLFAWCSQPQGFRGELKILTSPMFRVSRVSSCPVNDAATSALVKLAGCDPFTSVAVDFDFSARFPSVEEPVVQVALTYNHLAPRGASKSCLQRRMRVHTMKLQTAATAAELYNSCNADVVVALLSQKIMRASLEQGLAEARLLVQDFVVLLATHYIEIAPATAAAPRSLDFAFTTCPSIAPLPRLLFGLLKCPLMGTDTVSPDTWIYYHSLFTGLPCEWLHLILYPSLAAYSAQETLMASDLPLSQSSLAVDPASKHAYFVLDCLTRVFVYATMAAVAKGTTLGEALRAARRGRPFALTVTHVRGAEDPEFAAFAGHLVEDHNSSGMSFDKFATFVASEVSKVTR
eukprot:TRINITY_DN4919_c0_g2_i1.p1 TRINITY_DN4919_c0_g2~~TRINITY_DN4919_c0_g2_i1.p1  ORF type:complete len:704 (-),score=147.06 TRINITY_DN4919_c0_g2_i1:92-1897(-)